MNVIVVMPDGREAIPVRAIRYALWSNPPLPATLPGPGFVARSLRDMGERDRPAPTTVSAKIRKDGNIIDVLPGFWFTCVQRIEKAPDRKNDSHLPAGVFLWREDFETAVINKAFARLIGIPDDPAWRPWTYNPPVPKALQSVVLEGFDPPAAEPAAPAPEPPPVDHADEAKGKPGGTHQGHPKKLDIAQSRLQDIVSALERHAKETGKNFDPQAMPGPLGSCADEEGSFHWLCAQLDPMFQKSHRTFQRQRAGVCAVARFAAPGDFYRSALLAIAPFFSSARTGRKR